MILRTILTALTLNICSFAIAQNNFTKGQIKDDRDGKTYQTIKIGNTIWLAENMKFKTEHSDEVVKNDFGIKTDGYYYLHTESDEACPNNFEIPKESDWNEYVSFLLRLKDIPEAVAIHSSHSSKRVTGKATHIADSSFDFFEAPNPLNLQITGMIQGGALVADDALNFWSRMDDSNDSKYHLHVQKNEYGNHTHKHHIITKKKKNIRKFAVRCVRRS